MNKQVNILYTSHFSALTGGGQKSIALLVKNIDKEKFKVFLSAPEEGDLVTSLRNQEVSVDMTELPRVRIFNIFGMIKALMKLRGIVKDWNIDLIHTDSSRQTLYFGIVAQMQKIPLISHARVSSPEPWIYEKFLYHLSNKIIAVSRGARKRFSQFNGHEEKVEVDRCNF